MAQDNCQKIKLLKLYEILQRETDAEHPMTTQTIIDRLMQLGISCERRTVTKDMAILNEQGYEILSCWVGKEKGYYVAERFFTIPELKILIDAVQAASFIPDDQTQELIGKIAGLGGDYRADILTRNMVSFNTRKHSNEHIYSNVEQIEEAILQRKKIIFCYFDLNEKGQRVYRREGHHYVVEPIGLVFNEDNYYLMVYSGRHKNTANYRVDRMEKIEIIDEPVSEKALALRESVETVTGQAFKMYGGNPVTMRLQFDQKLIGAVYDKFGEHTRMRRLDENTCQATVKVQVSPTFWGWIFQFGNLMRITAPASMIKEYKVRASALLE